MFVAIKSALSFWTRMWWVWRSNVVPSMVTNVINPLLFVFAFGFGLGSIVPEMGGLPYFMYVVPGMMAQSIMFTATFETTIEAFFRFDRQRTWDAILATPIGLRSLLLGEVLWASTKSMISGMSVLVVGLLVGGVEITSHLPWVVLMMFIGATSFSVFGIFFISFAKSFNFFSYTFTFWVTPMFMFCGVLFPADRFPEFIQMIAWALPAWHLVELLRPLTSGVGLELNAAALHIGYLLTTIVVGFFFAYYRIKNRMFD